jgi:RNA polymerase sigma-70 factor (ECF subfamily)
MAQSRVSEREAEPLQLGAGERAERFNALYGAHAQFVARSLKRLGLRDELLDDALQEVFVIVYRKLPELDTHDYEKTWLYRIALNVAANLRRQTQRWHRKLGGGSPELPERPGPDAEQLNQLVEDEQRELLYRVLAALDDDKRNVFVLHELEQLSMPEVAAALDLNLNTAYSRLRSARAQFEKLVQRFTREDDEP